MQSHGTHADFLLAPEISGIKMPYFAQSAPPAYAQRCCGVGMEANGIGEAQVPGQALQSQANGNARSDAVELCFTTR